jgi:hypothetical protein
MSEVPPADFVPLPPKPELTGSVSIALDTDGDTTVQNVRSVKIKLEVIGADPESQLAAEIFAPDGNPY